MPKNREKTRGSDSPRKAPAKTRTAQNVRKNVETVVEDPEVAKMRQHLLEQLGAESLEAAMQDFDNIEMFCSGAFPPEDVGSALFAEMLMAAATASPESATLVVEATEDLMEMAEGDEDDKRAVSRAIEAAQNLLGEE
ncbi:MAG: hypothetical protein V1760_03230 [Candidatus Peregrinibacteria bacterium]